MGATCSTSCDRCPTFRVQQPFVAGLRPRTSESVSGSVYTLSPMSQSQYPLRATRPNLQLRHQDRPQTSNEPRAVATTTTTRELVLIACYTKRNSAYDGPYVRRIILVTIPLSNGIVRDIDRYWCVSYPYYMCNGGGLAHRLVPR